MKVYYEAGKFKLYHGDCISIMNKLDEKSVDLIFADPPYFLSNGGITCKAGKMVSVNKGDWDNPIGREKEYKFTLDWLTSCKRILNDNGAIWISGTLHNIYKVGFALEKLNYHILNEIIWFKPNAPPNLSCRYFTHSHETLIWAEKDKTSIHKFNYKRMKFRDVKSDLINHTGRQMRSVWSIPVTPKKEKTVTDHSTQKPLELLKRIISATSNKHDLVLDPFNGSGTTGIVAHLFNRRYIGIDSNKDFLDMTIKRLRDRKFSWEK